jgi:peptide/nickel transport system permease protein
MKRKKQLPGIGSSRPGMQPLARPPETMLSMTWKQFRRHPMAIVGTSVLLVIVLGAVLAPLWPHDPEDINVKNRWEPPSWSHPMGTDRSGRDMLARILWGGRISLSVGVLAALTSVIIGILVGGTAGYWGGIPDAILMRITDLFLCFPSLFVLILLSSLLLRLRIPWLQGGVAQIVLVIGIMTWMAVARLVRSVVLSLKNWEFVTAAHAYGATNSRIFFKHILPNAMGPVIVNATMGVAWAILTESGLSFLGYGVQPPVPSWGNVLTDAQQQMALHPWLALFPGFMIFITVICINFIGDALRDALDPHKCVGLRAGR